MTTPFQDYIAAQIPPAAGVTDWYRMQDAPGSTILHNDGTFTDLTPCDLNGAVVLGGGPAFLDGNSGRNYVSQDKDTVMATRADSTAFGWDRPPDARKWTAIVQWRPKRLKKGDSSSGYGLLSKGGNVYGIGVTGWTGYVALVGSTQVKTAANVLAPLKPEVVAVVFDSEAGLFRIWQDGEVVASQAVTVGATINHAAGGDLQVGGYSFFGNNGASADFHEIVNLAGLAFTDAQIKEASRLAMTDPAFEAGDDRMCFSWDRHLVDADSYENIRITNPGPFPVWLKQASSGSTIRGGWYLHPYGGTTGWVGSHGEAIVNYTGAWCGRHEGRNGGQRLSIVKS